MKTTVYKQSLFQLWCSSATIAVAVMVFQLYMLRIVGSFGGAFIAVLFGVFARSSDWRKCPIYSLGILAGACSAGMFTWIGTLNKSQLVYVGNDLSGFVGTIAGVVLLSFCLGYVIRVGVRYALKWHRSKHPLVTKDA